MPLITKNLDRINEIILLFFLLFFGIMISLHYGRLGFMPLDHSIVFDGGWRILSGQIPFRDFNTPNAIVPMALQAIFFKIFGKSWFFYCLHAALFNGVFCVFVYFLLRYIGGSKLISFFYACLSGFVYYPPMGVPFMEQHAFFFVFLAIVMSVRASRNCANSIRFLLWLTIPVIIVIAYLCKQSPTVFAVPVILFILLTMTEKKRHSEMFFALAAGFIVVFLFCLAVFKIYHMNFAEFQLYHLRLPANLFLQRVIKNLYSGDWIYAFFYPILGNHFVYGKRELLRITSFILVLFYLAVLFRNRSDKKSIISNLNDELPKLWLSLLLILLCRIFVIFTRNQPQNGIPYAFVSFGIMHIVFLKISRGILKTKRILSFRSVINFVLIFNACATLTLFNIEVNETRMVNDIEFNKKLLQSNSDLPSELNFMSFIVSSRYKFNAKDLGALVDFLKEQKENFFLLGDTSILYGLANKPSINPSLWLHPGLNYPEGNNFNLYEDKLIDNIKKYKVRFVIIEAKTWFNVNLENFPKLKSLIDTRGSLFKVFGGFKVVQLNY